MLEIKNLSAGYDGKDVLFDITASFCEGEITAIIGPNGCGKTTLLKAILSYIKSSGKMLLNGEDLNEMTRNKRAREISYLAQGRNIPDMTVEQLVLHGRFPHLSYPRRYRAEDKEIAKRSMEKMGIYGLSDAPLDSLSGGMRQNAYIAMALAQDTKFILLDEPTTYLDIKNRISLMKELLSLAASGKGIVTVLHEIPFALEYSNKIIVMDKGRVVASGTPDEIFESKVIDKVFGIEIKKTGESYYYGK